MITAVLDQMRRNVKRRMGLNGPEPAHNEAYAKREDRACCVFRNFATAVEKYLHIFQTSK